MTVKTQVLAHLESNRGTFTSGASIARALGVSRNSVWKAIRALESEGYVIEGVTNKGYRLAEDCDVLSAASIQKHLSNSCIELEFHKSIDSTNNRAKALATQGCPSGTLVVADEQTAGRGRQGRPFYSPAGTGVYFSLVIRPEFSANDMSYITSFAATCCVQAMEELFDANVQIKWVNDIFVNGHKCCGILTEAAVLPETGGVDYVVVGIGINVTEPAEGFPPEFAQVARALQSSGTKQGDQRARLVARIAELFMEGCELIPQRPHLEAYRRHSLLDGQSVTVYAGREEFRATVLGVNDDFTLQVCLEDGTQRALSHGEVHIPSSQLTHNR